MDAKYTDKEKLAVFTEYLVILCQAGNEDALQELMKQWHSRLYRYALGQLQDPDAASDATQESLISISKGIHRLKDPTSFPKWAYQILIRRCADWQRQEIRWRARYATDSASAIEHLESKVDEPETDTEALQQAIARLEPNLSNVVRLHYLEGFNLIEIGQLLKTPTGTIKSRLYYARKKLKQLLEEKNDD